MDRDRGRVVDRRGDGEVVMLGAGESYRPAGSSGRPRSPPRADTFRSRDRSPRRERARSPPVTDSWHPSSRDRSPRRRSRTPPRRDRSPVRDNWRRDSRARSPRGRTPPRRFSPRRDDRNRSPPRRDERRRSRSPYDRDRGAPRARSPISRRSPPAGPRSSFRPRSRSPDRRDIPTGPSNFRRRRSPSPARDSSGRTSGNTSRRSSPPVHQERMHAPPTTQRARSSPARERSPITLSYRERERERDSAKSTPRERSPVRPVAPKSPPRAPAGFRAPPTGPSSGRNFTAPIQPTFPTGAPPSRPRQESVGSIVPPAGPRAYMGPGRGGHISSRGGRGSFGSDRVSRPDISQWGAAPPSRAAPEPSTTSSTTISRPAPTPSVSIPSGPSAVSIPTGPAAGIPTGPRAGVPTRPNLIHSSAVYGRSTITNVQSGPRPHPAMANLPQIISGGRIDPTVSGVSTEVAAGLKRKEEEEERLRAELHAKEVKLRVGLRQWGKLERDSKAMGLRSELSERHVRMLAGEGVGGAAF